MSKAKGIPQYQRRREPGEHVSRARAVRLFCCECMGWERGAPATCTVEECWLYDWRPGAKKRASNPIKFQSEKNALERAGSTMAGIISEVAEAETAVPALRAAVEALKTAHRTPGTT